MKYKSGTVSKTGDQFCVFIPKKLSKLLSITSDTIVLKEYNEKTKKLEITFLVPKLNALDPDLSWWLEE